MGKFDKLTPLLKSFVEKDTAGCACSVTHHGETVYQKCFGYSDLELQKPISIDTIYRIYSMTKVITCTAALMLYERGMFLLNDPLEEYLPEFGNMQVYRYTSNKILSTSSSAGSIRIKDLFTMTSGLTYHNSNTESARHIARVIENLQEKEATGERYDLQTFSKALAEVPLAFDPGTHWCYGFSHDILGALIEVISGKTFGSFLKDEIFDPLDMKDTFFRLPNEKRDRLCSFYNRSEDRTMIKSSSRDAYFQPESILESGGGGLLSTITDFTRFSQILSCGGETGGVRILGRKTMELMSSNHLSTQQLADFNWPNLTGYGYGLGVRVMIDPPSAGSNGSVGEFGWNGLLGTWVMIDPKEKLSAVYMQQTLPHADICHQSRIRAVVNGCI